MRAIKFRGKSKDTNVFIYGDLSHMWNKIPFIMPKCFFATKDLGYENIEDIRNSKEIALGGFIEVNPKTIGQFTGKLDKNGIEIYEGDYLVDRFEEDGEVYENLVPVVWDDVNLMWCVDTSFAKDGSSLVNLVAYFGEHLEVKGNKHER